MVHALQQAHKLLRSGGWVVNIFDLPCPQLIEVHTAGTVDKIGWLMDETDFDNVQSAIRALARVIADGAYILEDEQDFDFNFYVENFQEFQEWLSEWWETAVLEDAFAKRIEALMRTGGPHARILLAERARMTKLRAA